MTKQPIGLTDQQIQCLIQAAKKVGQYGWRDSAMIRLAYQYQLKSSKLLSLKWNQIDLKHGYIHSLNLKKGVTLSCPLSAYVLEDLYQIQELYPVKEHIFISKQEKPLTQNTFRRILKRAGKAARIPLEVRPSMLTVLSPMLLSF